MRVGVRIPLGAILFFKLKHGQISRDEHLDPRHMPKSMSEYLKCLSDEIGISVTEDDLMENGKLGEKIIPGSHCVNKARQCVMGSMNVEEAYQEAARHLAKAATLDNAEGIYNLANFHSDGQGVKQDIPYAVELYRRAASLQPYLKLPGFKSIRNVGVAEAQHALGLKYQEGVGVHMDFKFAAEWYQKAADVGYGASAHNLALLYSKGEGVEKDEKKAEIYWKRAVEGKSMNAAFSLYLYYRDEFELDAARKMFDTSINLGNVKLRMIQTEVYKDLEELRGGCEEMEKEVRDFERKQGGLSTRGMTFRERMYRAVECLDPATEGVLESLRNLSPTKNPKNWSGRFRRQYDDVELQQRANQGSVTAARVIETLRKTEEFHNEWGNGPPFTNSKAEALIDILHTCLITEHQIFFTPIKMKDDFVQLVEEAFTRTGSVKCDFDRKLRLCVNYVGLLTRALDDDYYLEVVQEGLRRYPEDVHLHEALSNTYGMRNDHKNGLKAAKNGLRLFPDNVKLLFNYANHMSNDDGFDQQNVRDACKAFLKAAPEDNRKVPEAYYCIAMTYLDHRNKPSEKSSNNAEEMGYEEMLKSFRIGEAAEKKQLSCYLPYSCNVKTGLIQIIKLRQNVGNKEKFHPDPSSSTSRVQMAQRLKTFLLDPKRVDLITLHRKQLKQMKGHPTLLKMNPSMTPKLVHKIPSNLTELRSTKLKEMDPTKDHIYENRLLNLTIIEDPLLGRPSIHLIAEDEDGDVTRLYVYNVPQNKGTNKKFGFGCRLSVINPYLRIAADKKNGIRVDDPKCLLFNERRVDMCRYCGEENAPHKCAKCKWAKYCSRKCQVADWEKLRHKLICVPA